MGLPDLNHVMLRISVFLTVSTAILRGFFRGDESTWSLNLSTKPGANTFTGKPRESIVNQLVNQPKPEAKLSLWKERWARIFYRAEFSGTNMRFIWQVMGVRTKQICRGNSGCTWANHVCRFEGRHPDCWDGVSFAAIIVIQYANFDRFAGASCRKVFDGQYRAHVRQPLNVLKKQIQDNVGAV